ncbi:hypothetical protein PPACK8108_LOCUS14623 [Phakopsora pachyrhizi]|uniref:Uncharacterized protein n=1 Tax=Phakopsora pachyrhizi TaxID=170000 RepID=A0AAV0B5E6_PHAPC|nr:hypothetical protein PPACK8108_LOCUS14623 [Phakopsora pachyrhizi]
MRAHSAAATNSRVYLPINCSAALKVLKSSESAVGFQAVCMCCKAQNYFKQLLRFTLDVLAEHCCSASQRATKSVGIATPTYYANLFATRAKKCDISDENGSTIFTTNSGTQTSGSSRKKNALLPDGFSWKKNSQSPEEYSKRKFTLPSLNNMIARVKFCECPKNEDDKIYPLQPPRVLSIFYGTTHYGSLALLKKSHLSQHQLLLIPIEPKFTLGQNNCPPK